MSHFKRRLSFSTAPAGRPVGQTDLAPGRLAIDWLGGLQSECHRASHGTKTSEADLFTLPTGCGYSVAIRKTIIGGASGEMNTVAATRPVINGPHVYTSEPFVHE